MNESKLNVKPILRYSINIMMKAKIEHYLLANTANLLGNSMRSIPNFFLGD